MPLKHKVIHLVQFVSARKDDSTAVPILFYVKEAETQLGGVKVKDGLRVWRWGWAWKDEEVGPRGGSKGKSWKLKIGEQDLREGGGGGGGGGGGVILTTTLGKGGVIRT